MKIYELVFQKINRYIINIFHLIVEIPLFVLLIGIIIPKLNLKIDPIF